jgi:hypothetical protein
MRRRFGLRFSRRFMTGGTPVLLQTAIRSRAGVPPAANVRVSAVRSAIRRSERAFEEVEHQPMALVTPPRSVLRFAIGFLPLKSFAWAREHAAMWLRRSALSVIGHVLFGPARRLTVAEEQSPRRYSCLAGSRLTISSSWVGRNRRERRASRKWARRVDPVVTRIPKS